MRGIFQEVLVALATDGRLRMRLAKEGPTVLDEFKLDPAERRALHAVPLQALERYAASLVAKRWADVARALPLTLTVAPGLEKFYRSWLAEHPAAATDTVLAPGPAEALRALPAFAAELARDKYAAYAADLAAYEVYAACARTDGIERLLRSRFPLHLLLADLRSGLLPMDPPEQPTHFRFGRGGIRWRKA